MIDLENPCEALCAKIVGFCTGNHKRAPHSRILRHVLLLARKLCEGGEYASKLLIVSVGISITRTMGRQGARWIFQKNSDDFPTVPRRGQYIS
jgi:hypothetical protein